MTQFVIEREIPEIGSAGPEALKGAAAKSNQVLSDITSEGNKIKWLHSYVTDHKTFCIYEAESKAVVDEHAKRSGFPATVVTEIKTVISPETAGS